MIKTKLIKLSYKVKNKIKNKTKTTMINQFYKRKILTTGFANCSKGKNTKMLNTEQQPQVHQWRLSKFSVR